MNPESYDPEFFISSSILSLFYLTVRDKTHFSLNFGTGSIWKVITMGVRARGLPLTLRR